MSDLAGQLDIHLDVHRGAVAIRSSRPLAATRIFVGKSPSQAVRLLPTLFSLCGTAQAVACVSACEQALGRQPSEAVLARRQALLLAETIKEHLWRLLLDWPRMLEPRAEPRAQGGANASASASANASASASAKANATMRASILGAPDASAMPRVMRAFLGLRQTQQAAADPFSLDQQQAERGAAADLDPGALLDLVTEQVLEAAPTDWLQAVDSAGALQRWAEHARTPAAGLVRALVAQGLADSGANAVARLPSSASNGLAHALAGAQADAFIAAPQWQQHCAETGPLARVADEPLVAALLAEHGNGLLTRLAALLVELARSACELDGLCRASVPGQGQVPAAAAARGEAIATSPAGTSAGRAAGSGPAGAIGSDAGPSLPVEAGVGVGVGTETMMSAGKGAGIGTAEAARGLLLHRVCISDDRIEQYQILAPTEWNFHPQGVVAQGLVAIARGGVAGRELERLARLYITAVDPCVDYQLSVS
jgi:hypothetical protein